LRVRGRSSDAELMMAYLRALATEELDDLTYLELVSSTSGQIGEVLKPLAQARDLFRNWGFGLGKALRSVASTVVNPRVRGLVERMGKAVEAGMRSVAYVRMEYERMRDIGRKEMESALDHARTLGDLYMTLISTFTASAAPPSSSSSSRGSEAPPSSLLSSPGATSGPTRWSRRGPSLRTG
jgi:flagellar protein FlaJ